MSLDDVFKKAMTAASASVATEMARFKRTSAAHINGTSLRVIPHPTLGKYMLEVLHHGDRILSTPTTMLEVMKMGEQLIGMPHLIGHFVREMKEKPAASTAAPEKKRHLSSVPANAGHKIKAKSIVFTFAEGAQDEKEPFLNKPFADFAHANKAVREMAFYVGENGGYDKTDFTVTWSDGNSYTGRIDVDHKMRSTQRPLSNHMVQHLKFLAGTAPKPSHLTDEQWHKVMSRATEHRAEAIHMLATHDFGEHETVYEPRRPSGPTHREQDAAVEKQKKESEAAKLAKYPPAITERNEAIVAIRDALKRRSGKPWSVTGGKGTAWGWIQITAPPKRLVNGYMSKEDQQELTRLLGLDHNVSAQWESVPAGGDHRTEFVDRAEGRVPRKYGKQYWD